ncbi:MAG: STAS/SEC14 domain-containing protein [Amylibacter sp.]
MEKIRMPGQIKLLYWCGKEFEGFTAGAMWDDTRFGLMHLGGFLKIAFVTGVE